MSNPPKKHFTYTIKDFYREFKEDEKQKGKSCDDILPYKKYRKIVEKFFVRIMQKIIYDNHTFMMPYSLGSIVVKAFKTNLKKAPVDFHTTKMVGKVVRFLNTHTYGYYFGIIWDKSYVRFKNNVYYTFKATSSKYATKNGVGKKALSCHIKELSNDPTKRSYIRI